MSFDWKTSPRGLAGELHFPPRLLADLAADPAKYYLPPKFVSRGPGRPDRRLDVAREPLRSVHRALNSLLQANCALPANVCGGLRGRSVKDFATAHVGSRTLVRIDIKDFFPSIKYDHVRALFQRMGCSRQVSKLIATLLTRPDPRGAFLPQGCSASVVVANMVLQLLDRKAIALAGRLGVTYGRYIDDLVFSGDRAREAIPAIVGLLKGAAFEVSRRKINIMPAGKRQEAVGMDVKSSPRPCRAFRRKAFALANSIAFLPKDQRAVPTNRLRGMVSYAGQFDDAFSLRLGRTLQRLNASEGMVDIEGAA